MARPGVGALLRELDQAPPSELVDVCSGWLARHVSAQACVLLLADYAEASLEPVVSGPALAHVRPQDLMDSAAGEAYREQRRVTVALDHPGDAAAVGASAGGVGGPTLVVYLPVSIRAERLGVLAVTLSGHDLDPQMGELLDDVVRIVGYVLTGARRYTDRFEMLRRRRELGLAAEIQWELLPSLAFELPAFSIAGTVEPAYDIGGDNFDYAISAHRLTVSVSDAVGHGIRAALLASLAVTAMRNARRAHWPIEEQAAAANRHLVEQFPGTDFVTALILELDVDNGAATILNAGHPPPLLLRDGGVSELLVPPGLPLGLVDAAQHPLHSIQLHPGDRLLLFTDGITEAHRRGEREFGYRRVAAILAEQSGLEPPELVRHLTRAVTESCNGELNDDATAVCLDWHPPQATSPTS
uniref:SpoIIE family protein phosphatase n=1 Tax=Pseudonocardia charpentierae TaxID=3075545 RepID=A0ABU2NI02_9PSEU|nr:SpoIIE family protein phosphatase [Pseudonocardia sp. DSM 45834]MDT0353386.1 SpoIIE family protein phosphatase [Pseudonocardia sp. DSM 45834]